MDHQSGPGVHPKKRNRDRLTRLAARRPEVALGYQDEVWWSRVTHPHLCSWGEDGSPLRLVEQTVARTDPDPKALACYGLLVRTATGGAAAAQERIWLRFVDGRPRSDVTVDFLGWCCEQTGQLGKTALILVWDNASWHVSAQVRQWIRTHNREVRRSGRGVRLVVCALPVKSPWLNPIEPKWVHGKRAVVEPARLLTAAELEQRVCDYYGCPVLAHLTHSEKVS